ncbi:MAG TPA: NYN domain-containing protein [Coriobacteriia bacterium]
MRSIIVDGYNVLRGTPRYAAVAARDMDAARECLIGDLGARAAEGASVTIVFDGGGNPSSEGEPREVGGVTVIFSPHGHEADAVIEALAAAAREAGEPVEVVTSDGATRWTAAGGSVTVTRATSFARELADDEASWRREDAAPRRRTTVSDAVDDGTRERLDRMAGRKNPSGR